jgi:hypothetical protein
MSALLNFFKPSSQERRAVCGGREGGVCSAAVFTFLKTGLVHTYNIQAYISSED